MEVELILTQLKMIDHIANGEMLCEKIFEILQLANNRSRQAIIRSLEDIVDLMRHNEVVQKLMWVSRKSILLVMISNSIFHSREMIPNDEEFLTESSIDTFGNMCLNAENHMEICKKIVRFIKAGAPIALLPCFTKFILKFNSQQLDTLPMVFQSSSGLFENAHRFHISDHLWVAIVSEMAASQRDSNSNGDRGQPTECF